MNEEIFCSAQSLPELSRSVMIPFAKRLGIREHVRQAPISNDLLEETYMKVKDPCQREVHIANNFLSNVSHDKTSCRRMNSLRNSSGHKGEWTDGFGNDESVEHQQR